MSTVNLKNDWITNNVEIAEISVIIFEYPNLILNSWNIYNFSQKSFDASAHCWYE